MEEIICPGFQRRQQEQEQRLNNFYRKCGLAESFTFTNGRRLGMCCGVAVKYTDDRVVIKFETVQKPVVMFSDIQRLARFVGTDDIKISTEMKSVFDSNTGHSVKWYLSVECVLTEEDYNG